MTFEDSTIREKNIAFAVRLLVPKATSKMEPAVNQPGKSKARWNCGIVNCLLIEIPEEEMTARTPAQCIPKPFLFKPEPLPTLDLVIWKQTNALICLIDPETPATELSAISSIPWIMRAGEIPCRSCHSS